MQPSRIIIDAPRRAAKNMAIDQVLLESVADGQPAVLRFYQWAEPSLSLGYFQRVSERSAHEPSQPCKLVRRVTGGGALVHDYELTYSLSLPTLGRTAAALQDLYTVVHRCFAAALQQFGVAPVMSAIAAKTQGADYFLCFQRRTEVDLVLAGYKILGSAQRRTKTAVLQHGGLLLRSSSYAPELPGVLELSGVEVPLPALLPVVIAELTREVDELSAWEPSEVATAELERSAWWEQERFASPHWLTRRT